MQSLIPQEMRNLPGFLTLSRIPMALLFVWMIEQPPLALLFLYLGAMSDIIDGIIARKIGVESNMGGFLDGCIDKVFNVIIVIGVIIYELMSLQMLLLLFLRELIQLPTVPFFLYRYLKNGVFPPSSSHPIGKAATVILVVAVTAAVVQVQSVVIVSSVLVAVMGGVSALIYLIRDLEIFSFLR